MRIGIITNTFGSYKRQDVAVESWKHLSNVFPDVSIVDLQFKDEENIFEKKYDIPTRFVLEKSSRSYCKESIKKLPIISEILVKGFKVGDFDYIVYTNSDVILMPRLIEYIMNNRPDCMAGPRMDINSIDSFEDVLQERIVPVRVEIAGYDFFVFEKQWFLDNKKYFISQFAIGKPLFDIVFAGLMVIFGKNFKIANDYPMMALHVHHGIDSVTTECPERDHNISVCENNHLYKIANNLMYYNLQYNLCRRKPWGTFISQEKGEQDNQTAFFNAMNIHSENKIHYIK